MKSSSQLFEIEEAHFVRGEMPPENSDTAKVYREELERFNAKKAEAIALVGSVELLLAARASIFRGAFSDAKNFLRRISESMICNDPELASEVLLEKARLSNFNAFWNETIEMVDASLALKPKNTSLPALYQLRGNAFYELGQIEKASMDLDKVSTLAEIFPFCVSSFYAQIYEFRIVAREFGVKAAREKIATSWKKMATSHTVTPEAVGALFRCEIDCARLDSQLYTRFALGSLVVEAAMGDRLFEGISLLDFYFSLRPEKRNCLKGKIERLSEEFPRIAALIQETSINGDGNKSTTGKAMFYYELTQSYKSSALETDAAGFYGVEYEFMVLFEAGLIIQVKPWKVESIEHRPQFLKFLNVLANGPVEKETLFQRVWGSQPYNPEKHDNLIYSTISRIRKMTSLPLSSVDSSVELSKTLVIS